MIRNMELILKELAYSLGADLCGVASLDRFANAPTGYHPTDVLPSCRSVIVFAIRIPEVTERCTTPVVYTRVRNSLTAMMDTLTMRFCIEADKLNICCVPIPTLESQYDAKTDRWRSIISLKHAAQAAGLGTIGRNGLLITPQYGSMVWLGAVLCESGLTADPQCEDICSHCNACVHACPVHALDGQQIDQAACDRYAFGDDSEKQIWVISCHKCRDVCPVHRGQNNQNQK